MAPVRKAWYDQFVEGEMIDEATRMAKSKRAPASERIRWTRLAGQLIWCKDAILRSMSLESMENEMFIIKKVFEKKPEQEPPPGYMYPTFAEPAKRSET